MHYPQFAPIYCLMNSNAYWTYILSNLHYAELIAIFGRDRRINAPLLAELIKAVSRCSDRHAFVKLLHLFFSKMHKDSSRASTIISRRCSSSVDTIPATRRPISRELIRSQKSFEIPGMQRSALRLLGMCLCEAIKNSDF